MGTISLFEQLATEAARMRIAAFPAKIARLGGCGWFQRGVCLALAEMLLDPRKERLAQFAPAPPARIVYSEHAVGTSPARTSVHASRTARRSRPGTGLARTEASISSGESDAVAIRRLACQMASASARSGRHDGHLESAIRLSGRCSLSRSRPRPARGCQRCRSRSRC